MELCYQGFEGFLFRTAVRTSQVKTLGFQGFEVVLLLEIVGNIDMLQGFGVVQEVPGAVLQTLAGVVVDADAAVGRLRKVGEFRPLGVGEGDEFLKQLRCAMRFHASPSVR